MKWRLWIIVFVLLYNCSPDTKTGTKKEQLTHYVNPFIGTDGPGNTYPGATTPFGMVQLSPDIGIGGWDRIAGYYYQDSIISGFSHLHLTGTGAGDLYDILVMPTNSRSSKRIAANNYKPYSTYSHKKEEASPGYYRVDLLDYGIKAELTATPRVGIHKYTLPKDSLSQVHVDLGYALNWDKPVKTHIKVVDDQTLEGYRWSTGWARDQRVYFVMKFSSPFQSHKITELKNDDGIGEHKIILNYDTSSKGKELIVKTGLSTANVEGAQKAFEKEAPHFRFDAYKKNAEALWENQLQKIQVYSDNLEEKAIFYTMLYQSMLAPTLLSDSNGNYKGANNQLEVATDYERYDTFSLWDTFRAAHPLYTIMHPDRVADMTRSMLAHYKETGTLPVWSMQGNETNMMLGYHAVPVMVDAYFKGIKGFDAQLAYEACKKSAMVDEREIDRYKELGYVPSGEKGDDWSVSKTLEYAYDDWCIAVFAKALGKEEDAAYFRDRSQNWKRLHDKVTNFFRPKNATGKFLEPFKATAYTPYYAESNAWQYYWFVPQNIDELISVTGGAMKFEQKLDSMFTLNPSPHDKLPIFSSGMIGQYAHGNEPSHHVAYLYNYIGKPHKTQELVRKIQKEQYKNSPDGHCGNEDCGQMSSWYILSAMGMYPVNPAKGIYDLGSPLFEETVIQLEGHTTFRIKAENYSESNSYVKQVRLNGAILDRWYITHKELMKGGVLIFEMTDQPSGIKNALLPNPEKVY